MNFWNHLRRQHADAFMKFKLIVNKPTLDNVLASRNKRGQQCPVSDQTDALVDKGQMSTYQNTD